MSATGFGAIVVWRINDVWCFIYIFFCSQTYRVLLCKHYVLMTFGDILILRVIALSKTILAISNKFTIYLRIYATNNRSSSQIWEYSYSVRFHKQSLISWYLTNLLLLNLQILCVILTIILSLYGFYVVLMYHPPFEQNKYLLP